MIHGYEKNNLSYRNRKEKEQLFFLFVFEYVEKDIKCNLKKETTLTVVLTDKKPIIKTIFSSLDTKVGERLYPSHHRCEKDTNTM